MERRFFRQRSREKARMRAPLALVVLFGLLPVLLAACGGGGGGKTTAQTTTTTPVAHANKSLTISVTSIVTSTKAHDRSPRGTSVGDKVDFADTLLNARAGQFGKANNQRIGSDRGTMTFTSKTTARLDGVAVLPDGKIVFSGTVTVQANNSITVPVTGGTGKYKHASGTLLVGEGNKRAANVYRLVIDGIPGPVA